MDTLRLRVLNMIAATAFATSDDDCRANRYNKNDGQEYRLRMRRPESLGSPTTHARMPADTPTAVPKYFASLLIVLTLQIAEKS